MELSDPGRLAAVASSGLLDPERQMLLDHLAEMVQLALEVPVALVSIVGDDEQVFAGAAGLPEPFDETRRTPLTHSFCQHVVTDEAPFVVGDAREHDRVRDNLAIDALGVTSYCGVPISDDDGNVLGSLCAIDSETRDWTDTDIDRLERMVPILRDQIQAFRRRTTQRIATRTVSGEAQRVGGLLAESNRNLEAARAVVDEFLGVAAHDLRSPMATALTVVETLREGGDRIPREPLLDALQRSITRSLRLLDRLHDHARAGTIELETGPVDLNVVIRGVLDDVSAAIASRKANIHQQSFLPMVEGDDVLLGQLVGNLLGNALRYAADGERDANIWIDATESDDGVHLTVRDDGPGIPDDVAPDVFTAGVRGARGSNGIGLGLATCRTIVERHDGRIWIDRATEGGARVNVLLPSVSTGRRQVLVVEDDPDIQVIYAVVIEQRTRGSLRTRMASTLAEAEQLLEEEPLRAGDLAIIDLGLPDGDALELISTLVANDVQVHTVSSRRTSDEMMRAAVTAGASVTTKAAILERGVEDLADRLLGHAAS